MAALRSGHRAKLPKPLVVPIPLRICISELACSDEGVKHNLADLIVLLRTPMSCKSFHSMLANPNEPCDIHNVQVHTQRIQITAEQDVDISQHAFLSLLNRLFLIKRTLLPPSFHFPTPSNSYMPPGKPCLPCASPCIFSLTLTLTSKNLDTQRSRQTDSPLFRSASRYAVSTHFAEQDLRRLDTVC